MQKLRVQLAIVKMVMTLGPHVHLEQQLVHLRIHVLPIPLLQYIPFGIFSVHTHNVHVRMIVPSHHFRQSQNFVVLLASIERRIALVGARHHSNTNWLEQVILVAFVRADLHRRIKRKHLTAFGDHEVIKDPIVSYANRVHNTCGLKYVL